MTRIIADITMSLDGYVTAPGAGPEHGLGVGGEPLHAWVGHDTEVLDAAIARTGAVIMGRNTFDVIDGPQGWPDESGDPSVPPIFVVTHSAPEKVRLGDRVRFVADLQDAAAQARAAAGDKDVTVMGGGAICHAFLAAGLVDALVLHIAPIVLGDGTPLFRGGPSYRLERESSLSTPDAEHVTYRVLT
jgi:dihydrofolate reductase